MNRLKLGIYQAHSVTHWPKRKAAFFEALEVVEEHLGKRIERIVDIGCAHAPLVKPARGECYSYVGIEPEEWLCSFCEQRFKKSPEVSFVRGMAGKIPVDLSKDDVVVLNGVAHHIGDEELELFFVEAREAAAVIIVDHDLIKKPVSLSDQLVLLVQRLDLGNFVRSADAFSSVPGYQLLRSVKFVIPIMGITVWNYFSNVYIPD